jgi:tRNA(His) guanylyltransferase
MSTCPIMKRMKDNYESRYEFYLTRRTPVIIRLDGIAFHTYTKNAVKPFDDQIIFAMQQAALELCRKISGVKCAYVFSDEISLLLTDYDRLGTQAWYDYSLNKMLSASASIASALFNKIMQREYDALFDSRAFNIPEHDVNNYFVARQRDAIKNSIGSFANYYFSSNELENVSNDDRIRMLYDKHGVDWYEQKDVYKYGTFIKRVDREKEVNGYKVLYSPYECITNHLFTENPEIVLEMVRYNQ